MFLVPHQGLLYVVKDDDKWWSTVFMALRSMSESLTGTTYILKCWWRSPCVSGKNELRLGHARTFLQG